MASTIDATIVQLASKDAAQQASAAEALAQLGPDARPAAAALVRACSTDDDSIREWVTSALESLGPPPAEQLNDLIPLVGNKSLDVAYWAATLLGRLGAAAKPAIPALISALQGSAEKSVRERAAWALGQIGTTASSALPALREAAASREPRLSRLATEAVAAIGG
ncbi:MAG TPA: HEAT repeat domain-containing protein [Lacipirellulaceae bacterium]|jgi:HEAT repeat protein